MRAWIVVASVLLGAVQSASAFRDANPPDPASRGSSPSGGTIIVLHKGANSVGFYDRASGRLLTSVPVGDKPHEMALDADGRFVVITNYGVGSYTDMGPGGNTLSIVDARDRRAAGTIVLGDYRRPHGIERGSSGRFFITTDHPAAVLVVDAQSRRVVEEHAVGRLLPHMLAVTRDERAIFTADAGAGSVTRIGRGSGGNERRSLEVGGVPMGLALSPDDRTLYAATRDGNEVVVIDTARFEVTRRIPVAGSPARVQLTPNGQQLVVSLIRSGEAAIVDLAKGRVLARAKVGAAAEGIAIDASGAFAYVSAQGADTVAEIRLADGTVTRRIETGATPDPIILLEGASR